MHDAVDRILGSCAIHPALQHRSATGKLRPTLRNIAIEAGHDRKLITGKDCPYPSVAARLKDDKKVRRGVRESAAYESALVSELKLEESLRNDEILRLNNLLANATLEIQSYRNRVHRLSLEIERLKRDKSDLLRQSEAITINGTANQ